MSLYPYFSTSCASNGRSSFFGSMYSRPSLPRRSQCSIRSAKSWHAQPEPPSRKPKRRSGKRRVTPPRKMALATAWPAAAKWPIWLKVKLLGPLRRPRPRPPVWKDGAILSSRHFGPDRVGVVVGVEAGPVEMRRDLGDLRVESLGCRQGTLDPAAEHAVRPARRAGDRFWHH